MPKKILIILVVLTVLGVGGFFAWRIYQTQQQQKAAAEYAASSDKIADDFLRDIKNQDLDNAYNNLFSPSLRQDYSKDFWRKTLFAELKDSKNQPVLQSKKAVTAPNNQTPNRYDPRFNQEPTQYEYNFQAHGLTYIVTLVIYKNDGKWQINELSGDCQQ